MGVSYDKYLGQGQRLIFSRMEEDYFYAISEENLGAQGGHLKRPLIKY